MLACALLCMSISNTATAIMLLPIGAGILRMLEEYQPKEGRASRTPEQMRAFGTALVLGIAYACSNWWRRNSGGLPPEPGVGGFPGVPIRLRSEHARLDGRRLAPGRSPAPTDLVVADTESALVTQTSAKSVRVVTPW